MGRQLSHLLGTTGILLTMLLWLSLLDVRMADRLFDKLVGSQNEYKLVLGTVFLAAVFEFVAAIGGAKWWYFGVALSLGTLGFFTFALSV
jgi:hypothetical protein